MIWSEEAPRISHTTWHKIEWSHYCSLPFFAHRALHHPNQGHFILSPALLASRSPDGSPSKSMISIYDLKEKYETVNSLVLHVSIEIYLPSSITETTIPRPVILFSQTPVTLISCPMNRKLSCNKSAKDAVTIDYWKSVFLSKFSWDYETWERHTWKENCWAILPFLSHVLYLAKTLLPLCIRND